MHELSLTQSILNIALSEAEKHGAKKVTEIKIVLGVLGGAVPECIQEYFDLISEGTAAQGAKLSFRVAEAEFTCLGCGAKFSRERITFKCPKCESPKVKITSGREFFVEAIDIED